MKSFTPAKSPIRYKRSGEGLKLLGAQEAKEVLKSRTESDKQRLVEVQTLITQKYRELSQAEADLDAALLKGRTKWSSEEREHAKKIAKLEAIVGALEERRKQALIPLQFEREKLDTKASALSAREDILAKNETEIEQIKALLEIRLDEVSEREEQVTKLARVISLKEEGVQKQAEDVRLGSERLTHAISEASKDVAEKERAVEVQKAQVRAKELHIEERERKVNEIEASFVNREKALQDKRLTLERAIAEVKKKYGIKQTI